MPLECGTNPEYPVNNHTSTGSPNKLSADSVLFGIQTNDPHCCKAEVLATKPFALSKKQVVFLLLQNHLLCFF